MTPDQEKIHQHMEFGAFSIIDMKTT